VLAAEAKKGRNASDATRLTLRPPSLNGRLAGPPKILVGWATVHLAPPIIGLYVR